MHRRTWTSNATLPVILLFTIALSSCGTERATPTTNKRLPDQRVCDMVKLEDSGEELGEFVTEFRSQDGRQCHFSFKRGSWAIGQGYEGASDGSPTQIDSVTAKRFETNTDCKIDVWLVPGDISQHFNISAGLLKVGQDNRSPCDAATTVARIILNKLPD